MKIQLIDSDGNNFLEPAVIRQSGVIFAVNNTGRDVEIRDSRLIPETDFERLVLSHFGDNHFNVTDSYRTIVFSGDCVRLTERFANNVINNFRNQPTPIAHSCSNCEYFLRLGQTKICNGLQVPSEDPTQPTECGHWQEIDREERSRRDRELRRQVRDAEDIIKDAEQDQASEALDLAARRFASMYSNREGLSASEIFRTRSRSSVSTGDSSPQINLHAEDRASAALEAINPDNFPLPPRIVHLPITPYRLGNWPKIVDATYKLGDWPSFDRQEEAIENYRANLSLDDQQAEAIEALILDRACIHLDNLQRQIFLSSCLPPELLRDDKRPIANDQDQ